MRTILAIVFLLASQALAQPVSVSLTNQGYYTVGEFMPIEVSCDDPRATIEFHAEGALPLSVAMNGKKSIVAEMLMLSGDARKLEWGSSSVSIQSRDNSVSELTQPRGSLLGVDAYAPVLSWNPGASARTRRMAILIAVVSSIFLVASAGLLRSNRAKIVATFTVIVLATLGIEIWRRNIPAIWSATGQVVIARENSTQIDTWQYFTSRVEAPLKVDLVGETWPVFIDDAHAKSLHARLAFDGANSSTTLFCDLSPRMKLAICSRRATSVKVTTAPSSTTDSPMRALANRLYVNRNTAILGEGEVAGQSDQNIRYRAVILMQH